MARPWRRFKSGSVMTFKLEGELGEPPLPFFAPGASVAQVGDSALLAACCLMLSTQHCDFFFELV